MAKLIIQRQKRQAQYFTEDLGNGIGLDMILIPGGTFVMGSPDDEPERYDRESPQHSVTVPAFFMGRYAVTQAQWEIVSTFPQVNRSLKPNPSRFQGNNRPVQSVSWWNAVEFCDRLAQKTGRPYRLPSEAEWEYGCRAGTTTPFHFGVSITSEFANYDGRTTYGETTPGPYRGETTNVGSFPPNAFGLSDMHGNVWEWCLDHWHETYEGAPTDGSTWVTGGDSDRKVRRGGSWDGNPRDCRSAYRSNYYPDLASSAFGLRVVCAVPRILQ